MHQVTGAEVCSAYLLRTAKGRKKGMRRVVLLLSTMGLALLIVSGIALAQTAPGEVPDASCQNPGDRSLGIIVTASGLSAQTFTAEHTGTLTSVQVFAGRSQNTLHGLGMEIHAVDSTGTPTAQMLAFDEIPASEVPGQGGLVTFHFSPGVPVKAGQQYAIVVGKGGPGFYELAGSSSNPCFGRLYFASMLTGEPLVFRPSEANFDMYFSTFVTLPPTPQTRAECKNGGHEEFGFKNQGQCIKAVRHGS